MLTGTTTAEDLEMILEMTLGTAAETEETNNE
jgi:hypothetical protein